MENLYKAIETRLERLKADIRATMEQKNINASHRTEKALNVYRYSGGVKLVLDEAERAPLETLEVGRPGGAVPRGFYYIIKQWTIDKGISFANNSERCTFAYFVSKKIAREGTLRHHQPEDVYTSLTQKAADDCKQIIIDEYKKTLTKYIASKR